MPIVRAKNPRVSFEGVEIAVDKADSKDWTAFLQQRAHGTFIMSGYFDAQYPADTVLVLGPAGPDQFVMLPPDEDDERTTEEMPMIPAPPVCTCEFFPDPDCPVDHMGRNKPDPEEKGGLL